ncbi:MAG: hypothetical protein WAM60_11855 [Candidatus Promineifilaceae bacterium]
MPVVIKDFEVVGNGNGSQESAETAPTQQNATRPTSTRQVAQLMKFIKERAKRLQAD